MNHHRRFCRVVIGLTISMALLCIPVTSLAAVVYVDGGASGTADGTSWADAYTDLQSALTAAVPGDDIWVAAGTYVPTEKHGGSKDQHKSFQMKNRTGVYGGFAGWETARNQRDWIGNPTVLSGDIGTAGNPADNCYHVFYHPIGTGLDATAVLDGFGITGGNASGASPHDSGGGMVNDASSPTLRNCSFFQNTALKDGSGMFNRLSAPVLTNCSFDTNTAGREGGGIYNDRSTPKLTGCVLHTNAAGRDGGGMYNLSSTPTLANCSFVLNTAGRDGGAMLNAESPSVLKNCNFRINSAASRGGGLLNISSSPVVTNCIFWENSAPAGSEIHNTNGGSVPDVTYSDIDGGYPGTGNISIDPMFAVGDLFHLQHGSPCIDAGTGQGAPDNDFEGNARPLLGSHDIGVDEYAHWYGDFNADQRIELADPILCLQVGTGMLPPSFVFQPGSDVDMDGRPGLADAIFDTQVLAGIRSHPDVDHDQDGYTERNGDCKHDDNTVSPGVPETCGDGIDQNCDAADLVCTPETTYFEETFQTGPGGFFEEWGYSVVNGLLVFQGDDSGYISVNYWNGGVNPSNDWYPQPGDSNYFDDFYVSVTTRWDSGDPDYLYGLAFCITKNSSGDADWLRFGITKSGYFTVGKIFGGGFEAVVPWERSYIPDITGQNNQLGVQKTGNDYRFFINGYQVAQAQITDFQGGAIGLMASDAANISFDDYTVTDPYQGQVAIPSEGYRVLRNELIYKNMTSSYLWYDQVPALPYQDYASADALLEALKYPDLDHWSYIVSKVEHDRLFEEGKYIGIGVGLRSLDPDILRVKFVYPSSPAADAGLQRGDTILSINGKTIAEINANDLWDTIFGPDEVGVAIDAEILRTGQPPFHAVMEKTWVVIKAVLHTEVIESGGDTVGYLVFNEFLNTAVADLDEAFGTFRAQNIDELIVDLRYNPGGLLNIARYIAENIVAPGNTGTFLTLSHNDRYRDHWDSESSLDPPSNALGLDRLVVITTDASCSASESLINGLRPYMDVIVIGGTTCGKPVGMHGYDIFDLHISSIEFEARNANGAADYYDGLSPTCTAGDDLDRPLGHELEASLQEALHYVQNGACSSRSVAAAAEGPETPSGIPGLVMKGFRQTVGAF